MCVRESSLSGIRVQKSQKLQNETTASSSLHLSTVEKSDIEFCKISPVNTGFLTITKMVQTHL